MSVQYEANYSLYVPKLGHGNWRGIETVSLTATFTALNFTQAFERATILKPEHAELTSVSPY